MANTFLIDENGEIDLEPDRRMIAGGVSVVASCRRPHIVDTGHVAWHGGERAVSIYFRPAVTGRLARQRILSWLDSVGPQRVHLAYSARNAWHHELHGSMRAAADRMQQIFRAHGGGDDVVVGRRIKRRGEIKTIKTFDEAIGLWEEHKDQFEPELHFRALSKITSDQSNLFCFAGPEAVVPIEMRKKLSPGFSRWLRLNRGASITAFPDAAFSRSVLQAFIEADDRFVPMADEVDAFARWPGQYRRHRYHRLILPFQHKQERWIVSMSIFDDALDLHD